MIGAPPRTGGVVAAVVIFAGPGRDQSRVSTFHSMTFMPCLAARAATRGLVAPPGGRMHVAPFARQDDGAFDLVTIDEVGDSALYFLSDLSRGVTGEVHHVDSGYHIVGMKNPDAPDITVEKG